MEDPTIVETSQSTNSTQPVATEEKTNKLRQLLAWRPVGKQRLALYGVGGLAALGLITYAGYAYYQQRNRGVDCGDTNGCGLNSDAPSRVSVLNNGDTSTAGTAASLLNGVSVAKDKVAQRPLAVMIDNDPEARPQAGLGQADVVYEGMTEGGVTRFMAVFADATKAVRIGPIRSARSYFVDLATEMDSFYSHVGGSASSLTQLKQGGVKDLDQYVIGAPVYQRDFSLHVAVEHTVYSSTDKLWEYATSTKGVASTSSYPSWSFQGDIDTAKRPASQHVSVSVSTAPFDVAWDYDKATNSYLRSMAGKPHLDANTGNQISAKTIILQTVKPTSSGSSEYSFETGGAAVIIENGSFTKGTWKRDALGRTHYYDTTSKEIPLVKGRIWVHMVESGSSVSY